MPNQEALPNFKPGSVTMEAPAVTTIPSLTHNSAKHNHSLL
jgi:hypothetical protein